MAYISPIEFVLGSVVSSADDALFEQIAAPDLPTTILELGHAAPRRSVRFDYTKDFLKWLPEQ